MHKKIMIALALISSLQLCAMEQDTRSVARVKLTRYPCRTENSTAPERNLIEILKLERDNYFTDDYLERALRDPEIDYHELKPTDFESQTEWEKAKNRVDDMLAIIRHKDLHTPGKLIWGRDYGKRGI